MPTPPDALPHDAGRSHGTSRHRASRAERRRHGRTAAPRPVAPAPGSRRDLRLSRTPLSRTPEPTGGSRHGAAHRVAQGALVVALGAVTVVVPLGAGHSPGATRAATAAPVQPGVQLRALPSDLAAAATPPRALARPVRDVPSDSPSARRDREQTLAQRAEAKRQREERERRERAARAAARAPIPGCDPAKVDAGADNGRLHTDALCELPWAADERLRADAASALARLNAAYRKEFGSSLSITDSYRSYESQVALRAAKPGLAAAPGTSEHGWALAVDLGGGVESAGAPYDWLRRHAPTFGWDNPAWARSGGGGPYEPWHWEFTGAR